MHSVAATPTYTDAPGPRGTPRIIKRPSAGCEAHISGSATLERRVSVACPEIYRKSNRPGDRGNARTPKEDRIIVGHRMGRLFQGDSSPGHRVVVSDPRDIQKRRALAGAKNSIIRPRVWMFPGDNASELGFAVDGPRYMRGRRKYTVSRGLPMRLKIAYSAVEPNPGVYGGYIGGALGCRGRPQRDARWADGQPTDAHGG